MLSLSEKIDSYVTAMPAGNVTVVKLSANSSAVCAISVLLPSALVRHSSAGSNLMLLATEMTSDVANKLPRGKAGSVDEISLRSGILDLSLAQEASGRVSLILVDGAEAILFRLATEPPITGDACLFFDPNLDAWSSDGVAMLTEWELEDLGLNGSWCASNHTSFFAVAQTIPFSDMLDSEELVQDSAAAGILAGLACCALFIPGFLVFRRLGTPHAGQIWLKSQGRQGREVREVHFSCKLVLTEPSPEADSPTRSLSQKSALSAVTAESDLSPRMKADSPKRSISGKSPLSLTAVSRWLRPRKKTLVQWDLDPEAMMKDLEGLEGRQGLSFAKASCGASRESLRRNELSLDDYEDARSQLSRAAEQSQTEQSETEAELTEAASSKFGEEGLLDIVEELYDSAEIGFADHVVEAYKDGAAVLYLSMTQKRLVPATIIGDGIVRMEGEDVMPCYNCRLRAHRRQLRENVPLQLLRPWLVPGTPMLALVGQRWIHTIVKDTELLSVQKCRVTEECTQTEPAGEETSFSGRSYVLPLQSLRWRFPKNNFFMAYQGQKRGWIQSVVLEEGVEQEIHESAEELIKVTLFDEGKTVLLPTYLLGQWAELPFC